MNTRRKFLTTTAGSTLTVGLASEAAGEEKPLFSFGLMADCQYADAETIGSRFYRDSSVKLESAIAELNQHELAFSFHLGDLIDRDFSSFDTLAPITEKIRAKLYHALGNHDFEVEEDQKARVPEKLGLKNGYYSFQHHGFRFVVIDTTELSLYRYPAGTEKHAAAEAALALAKKEKAPGAQSWNGRPSDAQLKWLKSELELATAAKEQVIVLGHHPILPNEAHAVWNTAEMNRLFQESPAAKIYINGHNHAGHYIDSQDFHYLTLDGMLETKTSNAFGIAQVYSDRLEIIGYERQESHTLKFRS